MRSLRLLYVAQFLSAFADNALFFVLIGVLKNSGLIAADVNAQKDIFQAMFLVSFVIFGPIVGAFADRTPKASVLLIGNALKALGVALLFLNVPAGICYFIVGLGAVVYSPAKYGILTELTKKPDELLRANSILEGFTILAILTGTALGGQLADHFSDTFNIVVCILFYLVSLILTLSLPRVLGNQSIEYVNSLRTFMKDIKRLYKHPITRFSLISTASFWMISTVMRLALLVWLEEKLSITSPAEQSLIVASTAIGIVIGSLLTPVLIDMAHFFKAIYSALCLVFVLIATSLSPNLWVLIPMLLLVGMFGGLFVVPMNAKLQEKGKTMVGAGQVIAVQNFSENLLMLLGIGFFVALKTELNITWTIIGMALILLFLVIYLIGQIRHVDRG